jgi:hypothetical protein
MFRVGFEHAITASEQPQTHALDLVATGIVIRTPKKSPLEEPTRRHRTRDPTQNETSNKKSSVKVGQPVKFESKRIPIKRFMTTEITSKIIVHGDSQSC